MRYNKYAILWKKQAILALVTGDAAGYSFNMARAIKAANKAKGSK